MAQRQLHGESAVAVLTALFALCCAFLFAAPSARAMDSLDDRSLSGVTGRDGVNFNLHGFALSGTASLTYTAPNGHSLQLSSFAISRSDDIDQLFTDPYSLQVRQRAGGADLIDIAFPLNTAGLARWQFAADVFTTADGQTIQGGALVLQDLAFYGGGLQISTPAQANTEGVAFGLGLNLQLGALALRPQGRNSAAGEMRLSGLKLAGVREDGSWSGQPWALADVRQQPGLLHAITDAKGPALQLLVDWPTAGATAPLAGLSIDNVRFGSDASAVDLGGARIGSMQIQFFDVRLRPSN